MNTIDINVVYKIIEMATPIIQAIVGSALAAFFSLLLYLYKTSKSNEEINGRIKELDSKINGIVIDVDGKIKGVRDDLADMKAKDNQVVEKHRETRAKNREFIDSLRVIFDPLNHSFFDKIIHCLEIKPWENSYQDDIKNNIANDMMVIKLSYWLKAYVIFFKERKDFTRDGIEMYIVILIDNYINEWKKAKIPNDAIEAFNRKHGKRADELFDNTFLIIGDKNSDEIFSKKKFLDMSQDILDEAIYDIANVLKNINFTDPYQSKYKNPFQGSSKHKIFNLICRKELFTQGC